MSDFMEWMPIRRGGIWIGDDDCIEMMQAVDAMPPEWRAFVYEFGGEIVRHFRDEGHDAFMTEIMLEQWREKRQAELLAEDHITPRVIEGFKNAFRRAPRPPMARAA